MWAHSALRSFFTKPTEARAAKYCAVTEQPRPISPSATRIPQYFRISPLSSPPMPWSMIAATTRGTASSNPASSSLNSGPSTVSFL